MYNLLSQSQLLSIVPEIHSDDKLSNWEGRVHAGNTTYTADSHPNSTKPRQENNMNVNGYKNTEDIQKQTNIY